jgi:PHD/YefM family antitoxin component YafN of YafNO toxin-antitoxin module
MVERFVVRQMGALSAPQLLEEGVNRPVVVLIGADRFRGRGETRGAERVQGEHVAEYLMQPEAARALARRLDELADEILGPETT